jgi:hypothetical protein
MSGPIVRTGATPEFWKNWDTVFGGKKANKAAAKPAKPAAKAAAKPAKPAKKAA